MTAVGAERGSIWLFMETGILNGTGPYIYGPSLRGRSIQIPRVSTKRIQ